MSDSFLLRIEHKQVVVRGRWAKEGVQVYQDLGDERGSAGGMVDKEASIIRENERVGSQGFAAVRALFREALNPYPTALFIIEDEHDGSPPTSELLLEPNAPLLSVGSDSGVDKIVCQFECPNGVKF